MRNGRELHHFLSGFLVARISIKSGCGSQGRYMNIRSEQSSAFCNCLLTLPATFQWMPHYSKTKTRKKAQNMFYPSLAQFTLVLMYHRHHRHPHLQH